MFHKILLYWDDLGSSESPVLFLKDASHPTSFPSR